MNNGANPNNNNNGYNSEVLGGIGNPNTSNNQVPQQPETLEILDTSMVMPSNNLNAMNQNIDLNNNVSNFNAVNNANVVNNNLNTQTSMSEPSNVVPTQVTPEPAYTSLQNINPMPGFEPSGTIGTTPPISLEPEKQPQKKKTNKTLFVIIIIILLFGVGFGTYYILTYTDILNNGPKVVINTKNLEINVGDELSSNISDYANIEGTDSKNCNLNNDEVDATKAGTYSYQVTCGDVYNKGSITVVDNTELAVNTQKVYKVKGDTIEAKEFVVNPDENYTYEFVNQSEVEGFLNGTIGTYKIKINATSGEKTLEVETELVVLEHKIKGYLTCQSKEQNLENSSTKKIVQERFAIADDGNSGFGKVAHEIYIFKFVDETEYSNYLAKYKTDNTITIDNVTGNTEFDDENLIITITNEKTVADLNNKYGESNMTNYGTIRKYFMDTLGYECTYKLNGME